MTLKFPPWCVNKVFKKRICFFYVCTNCKYFYEVFEHIQKQILLLNTVTCCLPTSLMCLSLCCTVCFRDMLKYTANVREWMSADPKNIIAIHCKGGKGDAKDYELFQCHLENYLS